MSQTLAWFHVLALLIHFPGCNWFLEPCLPPNTSWLTRTFQSPWHSWPSPILILALEKKKNFYPCIISLHHQLLLLTLSSLSLVSYPQLPPPPHTHTPRCALVCRLWVGGHSCYVHDCNGHVISRRQYYIWYSSHLWLLHPSHPLFRNVP
jgi:hypothetical protein